MNLKIKNPTLDLILMLYKPLDKFSVLTASMVFLIILLYPRMQGNINIKNFFIYKGKINCCEMSIFNF